MPNIVKSRQPSKSSVNRNRLFFFFIEFHEMIGRKKCLPMRCGFALHAGCISRIEFRFEKKKSTIQNVKNYAEWLCESILLYKEGRSELTRSTADDDVPGDVQTFKLTNPMVIQWVLLPAASSLTRKILPSFFLFSIGLFFSLLLLLRPGCFLAIRL